MTRILAAVNMIIGLDVVKVRVAECLRLVDCSLHCKEFFVRSVEVALSCTKKKSIRQGLNTNHSLFCDNCNTQLPITLSLHSIVWKFCPKALFLGGNGVEIACALAVSMWNDGSGSLGDIAEKLQLTSTVLQKQYFHKKDKKRISHSVYKSSERSRKFLRLARKKRKGFEDRAIQKEGVSYASGAFDNGQQPRISA